MSERTERDQPADKPAEAVEQKVARIGRMSVSELRREWRETFQSEPPAAFSKELLARAVSYRVQEEAYGGLKASSLRSLRAIAKSGGDPPRQVKVGSVIVREHRGVLHEVIVIPGGFFWQGQTFDSLSSIAKRITGVSWSGPRFFGLRAKKDQLADVDRADGGGGRGGLSQTQTSFGSDSAASKKTSHRSGRRSSIGTGAGP